MGEGREGNYITMNICEQYNIHTLLLMTSQINLAKNRVQQKIRPKLTTKFDHQIERSVKSALKIDKTHCDASRKP